MRIAILVAALLPLLVTVQLKAQSESYCKNFPDSPGCSKKKNNKDANSTKPERKLRDQYARQFAAEVEHDGWSGGAYAMSPGCGVLCFNHGNHDCLRVFWDGGTVEAVDRFMVEEIQPRMQRLQELGFVEIDILGLDTSNSYPNGMARFPIK